MVAADGISRPAPSSISGDLDWPRPSTVFPSPADWRDETIYFLFVDRFSDGEDASRPLLDRHHLAAARPPGWRWDRWAESGNRRFQGGTLAGVTSRLDYLVELGVTAIWLSPCWKQRAERDDYHGYAIQHFLDVDPRFGTSQDLVDLVAAAHSKGLRVIFDIVVNHTGKNWRYASQLGDPRAAEPPFRDHSLGAHDFGAWLDGNGQDLPAGSAPSSADDGVWPVELQRPDAYHRAGSGNYGAPDSCSAFAEFRWADWENRDLALSEGPLGGGVLQTMIDCWSYWLRLTNCDGFRIDTYKHFRVADGRTFCAAIREAATELGKDNFFIYSEVGGGDVLEERYLDLAGRNLSATLELGELRTCLREVAAGERPGHDYFDSCTMDTQPDASDTSECSVRGVGTHRAFGDGFVYTLDDHDNISISPKLRFASDHPDHVVPGIALLLLTLGVPCIYYGTEQAFAGPEPQERAWLESWGGGEGADRYLREAMFGPEHPRRSGRAGLPSQADPFDPDLPGFGAFGTSGHQIFDTGAPVFLKVQSLLRVRRRQLALRRGRQYQRPVRIGGGPFDEATPGGMLAWSRILGRSEDLCVVNTSRSQTCDGDVTVDGSVNPGDGAELEVTADTAGADPGAGSGRLGTRLPVLRTAGGRAYVEIRALPPGEVLVLSNRPGLASNGAVRS